MRETCFCGLFTGLKTGFINLAAVFVGMLLRFGEWGGTGVLSCCVWVCSDVLINRWRRETSGCLNSHHEWWWWWRVGAVVHPGPLRVDAQAEKNERHGESRVKTGAATS